MLVKKLLPLLFLILPVNSFADIFEDFVFVECDTNINLFIMEERVIRGFANINKVKYDPRYYPEYRGASGECNFRNTEIVWETYHGSYRSGTENHHVGISLIVNGKHIFDNINIDEIEYIRVNPYKDSVEIFHRYKDHDKNSWANYQSIGGN